VFYGSLLVACFAAVLMTKARNAMIVPPLEAVNVARFPRIEW
jgi:hypothetical protein